MQLPFDIPKPWFVTRIVALWNFVTKPPDVSVVALCLLLMAMVYYPTHLAFVMIKMLVPLPYNFLILMAIFIISHFLGEYVEKGSEKEPSEWFFKGITIHLLLIIFYVSSSTLTFEYLKVLGIIGNRL